MPRDKYRGIAEALVSGRGKKKTQADQFIENTVRLRGLGPDDPIEWNAFGMEPEPGIPPRSPLSLLLGPLAPGAQAGSWQPKSALGGILEKMLSLGVGGDVERLKKDKWWRERYGQVEGQTPGTIQ